MKTFQSSVVGDICLVASIIGAKQEKGAGCFVDPHLIQGLDFKTFLPSLPHEEIHFVS